MFAAGANAGQNCQNQRRGILTKAGLVLGAMVAVMAGNNYNS